MKTVILTLAFCLASTLLFAQEEKEKTAIKNIVTRETISFMGVNRKAWAETWLPATYAFWSYADSAGATYVEGWQNIDKTFDDYFKKEKPSRSKITNLWQEIRIYGNGAYVRFIQREEDELGIDETTQVRVLEKKDGQWKIVCMNALAKYPN